MTKTDASRVHFLYAIRWVGVLLSVLWMALAVLTAHRASAATSQTINFQARLMQSSGAIVPDGTYNVEFKLYNTLTSSGSSAGSCTGDASCLWFERYSGANKISVANGYLTVELGAQSALPAIDWSQNLYLTMNIGGTGTSPAWDGEMSPRLHLTAVPHAFVADKLSNTNGSFTSTLGFTAPTASRSILLPDEAGTLCIQSSTNCGFAAGSGSTNYIQNQNGSDQTANFRISGSGRATTSFLAPLFDTATAVALNIGTTNATAINLQKSTTITGGITQSGGVISLAGNAASSITSSSSLTLTAAVSSNWTVGGTNQTLTISSSGAMTLGPTTAANMTLGSSANVINLGITNNAHTIHIGDGGTSTTQTITMGSTNGSSATTIQGGTGATAIALTTGTNGKVAINAQGTGGITGNLGSAGMILQTTTNSNNALQVLDSGGSQIFNVNTATGSIFLSAAQVDYSGFDSTIRAPFGSITLGQSNQTTSIIGSGSTTLQATSGGFTTTFGFTAPTANRTINLPNESGTVCLQSATSCGFAASSGSANYIQNGVTAQSANMYIQAATSGSVAATIRANAAGAGDILDLKNGAGTNVATFSSTGSTLFKTSTDSVTALQVQSNGGTTALNVDTTNARVGIGGIVAPAVSLDVQGGIQQTGLTTSNTTGADANKWTLMGTCTITAQFRQCVSGLNILGGFDGNLGDNTQATVTLRVKQQNALGGAPYVNISMNNTAQVITKNDVVAVTTQNDATATVVQLYGRITNTFEQWYFSPMLNSDQSPSKWVWSQSAGFLAALPAGTQTAAVYGDSFANTLTVQPSANSTSAFKVQNAAGTNTAFSVDSGNLRVAVGGTFNPQETVDVVGNLQVRDATTATKSYRLRTSGSALDFEGAGASLVLSVWSGAGYTGTQYNQITFKNDGSSMDFARGFNVSSGTAKVGLGGNVAPNYPLDVTGDVNTSTQYRIGGTVICTSTGCTPVAGSANYIQNTTSTQASSNFNISGTGIAGTALQAPLIDTASATTLSIGTTNATAVSIASNNATHTINIGNGGTSTVQTVNMGSTFGGSATTIQGGTGTSAIALTAGSGGNIKLTTAGTGSINLTPGNSGVFVRPTTDSTAALQVTSNTSGNSVFRVDTTNERVGIGVISDPIGAKLSIATSSAVSLRAYQGGASDAFQLGNATDDFLTVGSTGNFLMKPTANSANAFRIQNSGGAATLFTVDTSGNNVQIGSSTTDATAILLTLDSYSTSTDPTGVAGAMYYSTTYNAMRCYQDGAWANCNDPTRLSHGFNIQEDFIGSDDSIGAMGCGGARDVAIQYNWSCWTGGTATTGSADMVDATAANRPGEVQLSTGANAAGNESFYLLGGGTEGLFIGGGETFETAIYIPTLSNGTQTYVIRTGLCDVNDHATDCNDGAYFEYSSAASANWRYNTAASGIRTKTNSTKAVATGWTNLKFVATSSTSVTFYVKSAGDTSYTNVGTINTNVPNSTSTTTSLMMVIDKTVGTTARTFNVDYVDYWRDLPTTR